MRNVQFLNSIRVVLLGSGTFEDPFYGEKDGKDENDREQSGQQAKQSHTGRTLSIDRPDQCDPHDE
jgi:hypothetical protein